MKVIVDPEAVELFTKEAREIPTERIEYVMNKINNIKESITEWEGKATKKHEELLTDLYELLENTKILLTHLLLTLDQTVNRFTESDEELSSTFNSIVYKD